MAENRKPGQREEWIGFVPWFWTFSNDEDLKISVPCCRDFRKLSNEPKIIKIGVRNKKLGLKHGRPTSWKWPPEILMIMLQWEHRSIRWVQYNCAWSAPYLDHLASLFTWYSDGSTGYSSECTEKFLETLHLRSVGGSTHRILRWYVFWASPLNPVSTSKCDRWSND